MRVVYKITLIGSGNVATNLALAFEQAGHQVIQVWSRTKVNAETLSSKLKECTATASLDLQSNTSDIFILSVPDDCVDSVIRHIKLPKAACLAHTSGTVPLGKLEEHSRIANLGVFYPLQTFLKEDPQSLSEVPVLLESSSSHMMRIMQSLGESVSQQVLEMSSEDRKTLHVAAVFASNFTNHILYAAEEVLSSINRDIGILKPLTQRTIHNIFSRGVAESLTGPAKRGDRKTIHEHETILDQNPALKRLYKEITNQIEIRSEKTT